jgi:hypothetical protein
LEVKALDEHNSGLPIITTQIKVERGGTCSYTLDMRENDVYMVNIKKENIL